MLNRAIECNIAVMQLVRNNLPELGGVMLSIQDWSFIEQLYKALKPFADYTNLISEGRPWLHLSTSIYFELQELLIEISSRGQSFGIYDESIQLAFKAGKLKFDKYYEIMSTTLIYFVAAVLDPRIKGAWIEKHHEKGNSLLTDVHKYIHEIYPKETSTSQWEERDDRYQGLQSKVLQALYKGKTSISDIDRYFDSPVVDWDGNESSDWLLDWWRRHQSEYPIMSQVARDYLHIPAGEVAGERLFSTGRDLIGLRRYSLSPETMRTLILLRSHILSPS